MDDLEAAREAAAGEGDGVRVWTWELEEWWEVGTDRIRTAGYVIRCDGERALLAFNELGAQTAVDALNAAEREHVSWRDTFLGRPLDEWYALDAVIKAQNLDLPTATAIIRTQGLTVTP